MPLLRLDTPTLWPALYDDDECGCGFSLMDRDVANQTYPRIDIIEEKDGYIIRADLPGVEKDDITVKVENGVLSIGGTKKRETEKTEKDRYYHFERTYGEFSRSFNLSDNVDAKDIKAKYHNGILELTLRKTEKAVSKAIEVKID
ncbi:MAG: Hsp20/alpha crystallin family protein [Chitinivibrionales bacterium]|nr:Hsp20/alpha crystallin family protein [Chitinivibrionales bacterium]